MTYWTRGDRRTRRRSTAWTKAGCSRRSGGGGQAAPGTGDRGAHHLRFRRPDVCRPGVGIRADALRRRSAHLVGLPDRDPRRGRRRVRRGESVLGRTRLALRERHFGASLHHELGRHVALLDYELSRTWRVSAITRTMLPFYLCTLALYLSIWRINNEPFKWGTDGFPLLVMGGAMWYGA